MINRDKAKKKILLTWRKLEPYIKKRFWWQILVIHAKSCYLLLPLLHPLTVLFLHCKIGIDLSAIGRIFNFHSPCDEIIPPTAMGTTTTNGNFSTKSNVLGNWLNPL
jgi:hypothetical protein